MKATRLAAKVLRTVNRYAMVRPGDKVLVACSGGGDSTALLRVLFELRSSIPFEMAVAHFDHGLRADSARDAAFVHDLAGSYGLPFHMERSEVRPYARRRGLNLEEAGRALRYEFLRSTSAEIGATRIATGHTLDDQAETVLMRLLRGSGARGLGGIAPVVDGLIIRPLLEVRRREVEDDLRATKTAFRRDQTNRDRRFLRNKIRLSLIPVLERDFEPRVAESLGRLAEVMRDEDEVLDGLARKSFRRLSPAGGRGPGLSASALSRLPAGLARRVVRIFIEQLKGDLRRISFGDVESVRRLAPGKTAVLPGGIRLVRDQDRIEPAPPRPKGRRERRPFVFRYLWDGRSPLSIAGTGAVFSARFLRPRSAASLPFDDSRRAVLDADRLVLPLTVRSKRDGDRYRPFGAPGGKKLKEIFRAKGVPLAERAGRAVFESGRAIVWVEGLPVSDDLKVTPSTRRVLLIEKQAPSGRPGQRR